MGYITSAKSDSTTYIVKSELQLREEEMNIKQIAGIVVLIFALIMGCAGNYGIFKRKTGSESKATKRELIDNWSDYDILLIYQTGYKPPRLIAIIFDAKNDDKKILVDGNRSMVKVKDQEMWTKIVKTKTTSDGDFSLVWAGYDYRTTGVQEIWGSDNQLYGFIIYQQTMVDSVDVKMVDENTMQLSWQRGL